VTRHGFNGQTFRCQPLIDARERSGRVRPYVRPVCGAYRWPSWACACVSGTNLAGVLEAQLFFRCRLNCSDHSLSHHVGQRLPPDQSGSRPTPTVLRRNVTPLLPPRSRFVPSPGRPLCASSTPRAESARGISPRAAHRTVREPLDSYGSCHSPKTAVFRRYPWAPPVSRWPTDLDASDPPP
jgi:hypothetical protein